jgi:hypothetical protein
MAGKNNGVFKKKQKKQKQASPQRHMISVITYYHAELGSS